LKSIYSQRQERLCAVLAAARTSAGLTQAQWAARLGIYRSFVSKYEKGERRLDVLEFVAVMDAIGIDAGEVLRDLKGAK
jgi:transcriptional regulator with XRE-family HTH domain